MLKDVVLNPTTQWKYYRQPLISLYSGCDWMALLKNITDKKPSTPSLRRQPII